VSHSVDILNDTHRIYSQKKSCAGVGSTVVTYFCAQLEGEERKRRLHEDCKKRRGRVYMPRYPCGGWLHITVPDNRALAVRIRMKHDVAHPHFSDISLPEEVRALIEEMKGSTPSDVRTIFQHQYTSIDIHMRARYGQRYFASGVHVTITKTRSMLTGRTLTSLFGGLLMTR
jgi:hypothetical protein